ncbi:uncharacterized protein LOC119425895 [Nematolebias whitei]|uniref:uncharacterized protein LOC119425895 n=1 Tax=Nematolebias whitei TaxID=451745 RepID=UPI0018985C8A|nr:uncharacterized protein LOC119425895 [Nematolebias whitei]
MEISDSDMCTTSPDSSAETGSACRPSHVKVNKSDSLPAGVKLKVPTAKTNWSPESNLSPDTPVKTIKFETASKAEKMATPHTCSVPTLKSASTSSKRTETTPSFSATISNATPTAKSATQSVQVKSRKGSASEVNSSSGNASQASCRTSSKVGKSSRWDDATPKAPVAHLTKGTSVAPAKMAKTLVKHDSPDAPTKMAHGPKLVGENADSEAHKKTRPSVPRLGTTIPASSENSEPLKEPYLPASKSPSKHSLKVGANQLIVVSCEKKMQVYCLLCSDKLNSSSQSHLTKFDHQHKYMKMKYPEWTAEESQLKSKLRQDLLHLVLIEKDLPHTRLAQKLEVEMVVYEKLRTLSGKKAVEKVKELLRRKDAHIPLIPAADSSSASRQNVFSFCEVSSSDDGMPSSYDEAGIQDQMAFFQMPEMDSHVKEDLNLMAYDQSLNDEVMEVYDRVQDQVDLEPIQNPGFYAEDVADTTQLEPDAEFQCGVEVTPPAERFGLTVPDKEVLRVRSKKQPDRGNKKLHQTQQIQIIEIDDSESEEDSPAAPLLKQQSSNCGQIQDQLQLSVPQNKTRPDLTLSHQAEQIPGAKVVKTAHSLTPETQRRKSESASQGPRRAFECPQKATPVQTAASSARHSASGPSHGAQQAPNHSTGPGEKSLPQVQHRAVVELKAQNCSNLSRFLSARYKDTKPIIGMEFVWECQGMSAKTFYLCESCQEIISFTDMCQHMVSKNHQTNFLWQNYSQFLDMFLDSNELNEKQKSELFDLVVEKLWAREQAENTDARVLILPSEQHGLVQTAATFSKALQLVKGSVDKKPECHPPISQQNKTGQKAENPSLEKKAGVGDLHVVGERIVIDLEAYPSCSKDAPVVSSVPIAGAHLVPQEACCGLFPQPAFKPHVSNLRNSDPQLQEKPVSESSTSTTSTSTTGQKPKVYLSNESLPNRKRAAETPETLLQSCTISPQKHPLPAKHTPNPVNVMTQHKLDSAFSAVNSAENLTPLAPTDNNSEPTQMKRTVNLEPLAELISMMKQRKFENIQTPPRSALDNAESTSSSDHRRDLKPLNIDSENAKDKTTLGSEHQLVKATAKKNSTSYAVVANKTASFDVKKNLTTGVSAASSANILSAQFVKANRPADETGDAVVVVSTAATAEAKAPHMLPSSSAQDVFTNVSSFSADCAPNNQKTHRMPHNNPEPSGSSQQSISTVISARPNLVQHTFQGSKNWQAHADANRNDWVTSHADPTANLTDTAAVSGGSYAPHGQTVYFTGGDSGSFFTQMPTGYTTQNNPPITAASSTQEYVYPNQMYPDQTGNPLSLPSFSYNVTAQMPPGWECLGVQQQYAFWAREPGSNQ